MEQEILDQWKRGRRVGANSEGRVGRLREDIRKLQEGEERGEGGRWTKREDRNLMLEKRRKERRRQK